MQWVIQDIINSELAYLGYEGVVNGGRLGWYYLFRWGWKYIQKPSEALHIEEGAAANNTLYSNRSISFDRQ